jgi:hypothetical protein
MSASSAASIAGADRGQFLRQSTYGALPNHVKGKSYEYSSLLSHDYLRR